MTFNRDKATDIANTIKMTNKISIEKYPKSWLGHSGAGRDIDYMLLRGATFEQLLSSGRKPNAIKSHLHHLKVDHGLSYEKNDGVYIFSSNTKKSQGPSQKQSFFSNQIDKSKDELKPSSKVQGSSKRETPSKHQSLKSNFSCDNSDQKHESNIIKFLKIIKKLAHEKKDFLDNLKKEYNDLKRDDFIWHYLLQSFSTMGRASGWYGLIKNKTNYNRVTFEALDRLPEKERNEQIKLVCHESGIRMPNTKADYLIGCFALVKTMGGLKAAKQKLLSQKGREGKIQFLQKFPGIGPKYARNIMMDVYHEDFRDSIAIDIRIKAISEKIGLKFSSYPEHEDFLLRIAKDANINGWELDRLMFNFRDEIEAHV